jgi:hypothetical protein
MAGAGFLDLGLIHEMRTHEELKFHLFMTLVRRLPQPCKACRQHGS